jgi:hypothetical protein
MRSAQNCWRDHRSSFLGADFFDSLNRPLPLTAARARGRVGGRPRKMTPATLKMAMAALADPGNTANDVARPLGHHPHHSLYLYQRRSVRERSGAATPRCRADQ